MASYKDGVQWIAEHTTAATEPTKMEVLVAFVGDLFEKDAKTVAEDVIKARKEPRHKTPAVVLADARRVHDEVEKVGLLKSTLMAGKLDIDFKFPVPGPALLKALGRSLTMEEAKAWCLVVRGRMPRKDKKEGGSAA